MKKRLMIKIIAKKEEEKDTIRGRLESLSKIRTYLINDSIAKEICENESVDYSFLLGVPISFDDIDVTAKTINGSIFLNPKLIDMDFAIMMRYVIHELVHVMQHMDEKRKINKNKNYLNREDEIEAFQYQIEYDAKNRSEKEALEYVDELLEFHDVPDDQVDDKRDELLSNAK